MKIVRKLFLPCMILGACTAQITFYILLKQCFSETTSLLLTCIPLIPFVFYGIARVARPGKLRVICNVLGAALLSADCYFMIFTAGIGVALLLGVPLRVAPMLLTIDLSFCALSVGAGMLNATRIRTVRYTVKLKDAKPCKLVFFSDLHLGSFCTVGHLRKIVNKIRDEKPDLVLFGGDLIDMDMPSDHKCARYADVLANVGGIIGCEGNHDLNDPCANKKEEFLKNASIRLLYDEAIEDKKTGLGICGRKSIKQKRQSASSLCPKQYPILLDHDPKGAKEGLDAGFSLILCGHTHKGQTFPGNLIRRFFTPYFYGKYDEKEATVITTGGCGSTGLPLRLFVTNEIVAISIVCD